MQSPMAVGTHPGCARFRIAETTGAARPGFQTNKHMARLVSLSVVLLVACILAIVISPYVDLPNTTLRSQTVASVLHVHVALFLSSALLMAQVAFDQGGVRKHDFASHRRAAWPGEDLVRFTCAYLC
jgi:hypothetical protein